MIKKVFFYAVVYFLIVPAFLIAETLDSQVEEEINQRLYDLKIFNTVIDLNVRISIPENEAGIPASDLFATVIRPASEADPVYSEDRPYGRPTIFVATPYRRDIAVMMYLTILNYDYNLMVMDVRGTGSSSDQWLSLAPAEHYDMAYVIDDFIPDQYWSDGKVGMMGQSYMGISQLLAVGQIQSEDGVPKHLKAIFPMVPMSDSYRDIVMQGGNLNMEFIPMWLGMVDILGAMPPLLLLGEDQILSPTMDELREAADIWQDHVSNIPVTVNWIIQEDNVNRNDFFDAKSSMIYWPDKPSPDGWSFGEGYPEDLGSTIIPEHLPVFITGGWFDIFTRGTLNAWEYGLKNHSKEDKCLIVGPWYHVGGSAGLGIWGLMNSEIAGRWFDWKIKGIEDPFLTEYPALIYVMGANQWRAEKEWPLPESRTEEETLYLSKNKFDGILGDWFSLGNSKYNYSLVETPAKSDYFDSYWFFKWFYTPKDDPVLTHSPLHLHGLVSRSSTRWVTGMNAMFSQMTKLLLNIDIDALMPYEDERIDEVGVLTFTSERLDEDIEIAGPMTLTFWAKTDFTAPLTQARIDALVENLDLARIDVGGLSHFIDKKDVQWVVEVNDVFPSGRAKNISSGWLSAENRPYDSDDPDELDPDYVPLDPFYMKSYRNPSPIEEGIVYPYVVEIWPSSNVFKKGHRIRVSISASDFPHLFPVIRPSENTIVIDEDHPARLDYTRVTHDGDAIWLGSGDPTDYIMESND